MAHMTGIVLHSSASTDKGVQKRSPREELALRVRILNGRHVLDALQRVTDELGDERAEGIGPVDLARNPLLAWVNRTARAHGPQPPMVDDLPEALAAMLGDMTARVTVAKYAPSRPMPTGMRLVCTETLRWKVGCNYGGTLLGYSEDSQRPYLVALTPDTLEVDYRSDDPRSPTVIRHFGQRLVNGKAEETTDTYDLTDLDAPSYTITMGHNIGGGNEGVDVTEEALGPDGWATLQSGGGWWPWWRLEALETGKPFHRIVIQGDPRQPYRNIEIAEGTLGAIAIATHARAGVRDAGWPRTHTIGLKLANIDADARQRQTGQPVGPEYITSWQHIDPERPGSIEQHGPGFDPESTMKAARLWELGLIDPIGLPVDFEGTGGDPQGLAAEAQREAIQATYDEARGHDGLVLKRIAAMTNRATEWLAGRGVDVEVTAFPEELLSVLYREEVTEALASVAVEEADEVEVEAEEDAPAAATITREGEE